IGTRPLGHSLAAGAALKHLPLVPRVFVLGTRERHRCTTPMAHWKNKKVLRISLMSLWHAPHSQQGRQSPSMSSVPGRTASRIRSFLSVPLMTRMIKKGLPPKTGELLVRDHHFYCTFRQIRAASTH